MSRRADAPQCGGVVVEFESESEEIRDARKKKARSITGTTILKTRFQPVLAASRHDSYVLLSEGSALIYLRGPKFLIYVSGALSMWVRILLGNKWRTNSCEKR